MTWLLTFTAAYPLDACLWLVTGIVAGLAVLFAVGLYRALRLEMREDWDVSEGRGAHGRW